MMRLFFVNRYYHPDASPTAQLLGDVATHLAASGYDVTVITSRQFYKDPGAGLPREETREGVKIVRVRTTSFGRKKLLGRALDYLTFYAAAFTAVVLRARRGDAVVAKTDPPMLSVPVMLAAGLRGARTVNWLQDVFPEIAVSVGVARPGGMLIRLLTALRDLSLRAAATNVVIDDQMAQTLERRGIDRARIAVISAISPSFLFQNGSGMENRTPIIVSSHRPIGSSILRA